MVDVIAYRACAGLNEHTAKLQQFVSIEQCLDATKSAAYPGEIFLAPVTRYGVGRWIKVGRYDGRGRVFVGQEDEDATEAALIGLAEFLLRK